MARGDSSGAPCAAGQQPSSREQDDDGGGTTVVCSWRASWPGHIRRPQRTSNRHGEEAKRLMIGGGSKKHENPTGRKGADWNMLMHLLLVVLLGDA